MKRLIAHLALITASLLLTASSCQDDSIEVIESYDASIGQLPEGVAVDPDGNVYVTLAGTGELRKLDSKTYTAQTLTQFDVGGGFLLGMAFKGDELYVALASFVPETSGIWHVSKSGVKTRVVDIQGFPNDLTFDRAGNMYVTESISGSIYKVPAGSSTPQLWFQDPLLLGDPNNSPVPFPIGVNGIAYDDVRHSVIVVNSQNPAVIEIKDQQGSPGNVKIIASGEHLRGADGLAIDWQGDLYVVSNAVSTVSEIDRHTGAARVVADASDGLVFPSTIAFGRRLGDRKAVYVVNFGFGAGPDAPVGLLRIPVGEPGEAFPAGN